MNDKAVGLEAYVEPKVFVPFGADEDSKGLMLRGLNTDDITGLLSDHLGAIANAVDLFRKNGELQGLMNSADRFVISVLKITPGLAAGIIACAADQPDKEDAARRLSFGFQMRALSEIMRMTLEDAGGVKNLYAALAVALPGIKLHPSVLASLTKTESSSGIGATEET
jgi:hypothetical protein